MSDDAIRALERELQRSGKTIEEWAVEVLARTSRTRVLEVYMDLEFGPGPAARGQVSVLAARAPGLPGWTVLDWRTTIEPRELPLASPDAVRAPSGPRSWRSPGDPRTSH